VETEVKVIGGKSIKGSVSILSDKFVVTAVSGAGGKINCTVNPMSETARWVIQYKNPWMPKLLRLLLFLREGIGTRDIVFFGLLFTGLAALLLLSESILPGSVEAVDSNIWLFNLSTLLIVLLMLKASIAKWHGAEHMTIAAYISTGMTDLETIKKQSPIDPHCGGRFIIGIVAAQQISNFVTNTYVPNQILLAFLYVIFINAAMMEIVLRIDAWKGLDKLPVTSQASYLLQKYFTTAQPGDRELLTAKRAMDELIAAHRAFRAGQST